MSLYYGAHNWNMLQRRTISGEGHCCEKRASQLEMVGWSTSSIRRRDELPKCQHFKRHEKYPRIVNVETAKPISVPEEI
ncbi:hypothetical protein TSUD_308330 [Trifolium subterraneum]|nr:hypothetical protein TSUD_308330 [Trifolium subterraneum]